MSNDFGAALRELLKSVLLEVAREVLPSHGGGPQRPQSEPTSERMLLRASEAAELLTISERQLHKLTRAGMIPCVRIGRLVRYAPEALRESLARSELSWQQPIATVPTRQPTMPSANDNRRTRRKKKAAGAAGERAKKTPKQLRIQSHAKSSPPARPHQSASAKLAESQPRNLLRLMASQLGVDERALPQLTNGDIMRIAGIDIPTLHGWTYRNGNMPEVAMNKLREYFAASIRRDP